MNRFKFIVLAASVALLANFNSSTVGQEFQKDATWVPESANVIVMVRMQDLLNSELGKAEKWRTKQYHSFKSGLATFPTSAKTLMIGAQIDLEYMQPLWQVAVYKKDAKEIDMDAIKKRSKEIALPAQFGSYPALCVRSDAYLVKVASDTMVAMEPANRQATSRWLKKHGSGSPNVSPYLMEAIKFANSSSHFIVAVDMNEAVDVERIKLRLSNSPLKIENMNAVCEALASVKGMQMAIRVTDKINGAIKVDFSRNASVLMPYAKDIMIAALERNGFMIDDFRDWKLSAKPGALVLEGTLSNEGFNEIGTFVRHPITKGIERAVAPNQSTGSKEATIVETTKGYLDSVKDYVVELNEKKGRSMEYRAKFFEQYAYQIDGMYSSDIDPIALEFGRSVASDLREMSTTLRQQEFQRYEKQMQYGINYERAANQENNSGNNVYWNGWGNGWNGYAQRYGKYTTERVKDQKRIDNYTQKEAKMKLDVLRMDLTKRYNDVKIELSKKYKTKF